jgi:hypothetical protein
MHGRLTVTIAIPVIPQVFTIKGNVQTAILQVNGCWSTLTIPDIPNVMVATWVKFHKIITMYYANHAITQLHGIWLNFHMNALVLLNARIVTLLSVLRITLRDSAQNATIQTAGLM